MNQLVFGGDVMFSRGVRREILFHGDPAFPFRRLAPYLTSADISFVNLESPFSDKGPYAEDGLIFHSPPAAIAGFQLAGIDVVSTANNHARDCGAYGVRYTVQWLSAHGIQAVGSAETAAAAHDGIVLLRHGVRFGFLGYTFDQQNGNWRDIDTRIAMTDEAVARQDISALRQRCDVVIVSMHCGTEYQSQPNSQQISFARHAIDAGAALVIGHHPHVIQAHEHYRGGDIFYSLGNLVFDQYQRDATQHGELVEATFVGTNLLAAQVLPVKITPAGPDFE